MLPDKLTPLSHDDLIAALRGGYPVVFGRDPIASELAIYYAQCLEENGATLGGLHCYGLGNVKATPSWTGDVTQYACDETVSVAEAAHAKALGPCELHPQPSGKVRVVCTPPHPWCTFRAFSSATEAARRYLQIFKLPRYAQAALRARAGDPVGFVQGCAAGGYMTTPNVDGYARAVASIATRATPACASSISGNSLGLTPDDVEHIQGQVALWHAEQRAEMGEPFPLSERDS